jgi:SprT-like family
MNKRAYFRKYLTRADEKLGSFCPTPRQVARAHTIINNCIFDGQLSRPRLVIRYQTNAWGMCNADLDDGKEPYYAPRCTSIIVNNSFRSKRHFIEVLAHEMVHQYQVEFLNRIDHGKTFWAWKEKFEKYNLKLRIAYAR